MAQDAMTVVQRIREIAELVKKYNDGPLYEKLIVLQAQVVELATERLDLHAENEQLKQQLERKAKTTFRNPYYYEDGDEVPLCPKCFASSSGAIRMHLTHPVADYMEGSGRYCQNCKEVFIEGPRQKRLVGQDRLRGI